MNTNAQHEGRTDVGKTDPRLHKAGPAAIAGTDTLDPLHCGICGQAIHAVSGGNGSTFVHTDSGAVVARDPPLPVAELLAERDALRATVREMVAALDNIHSWLVCSPIATAEDMAQSFDDMEQVAHTALANARKVLT